MPVSSVGPLTTRAGMTFGSRAQLSLNGVEGLPIDERRGLDLDDFARGFENLGLAALVELAAADMGPPRQ